MPGDEGGASRAPRERRASDSDDVFRSAGSTGRRSEPTGAATRPRHRSSRPVTGTAGSRWTDPAPTSGVWDPRGATPEQRREVYEDALRRSRWWSWAGLVVATVLLVNAVVQLRDGTTSPPLSLVYVLFWSNLALGGAVRARQMTRILGLDPEEPVEHVIARVRAVNERSVYPAVAVFDLLCTVLVLLIAPEAWLAAAITALVALVLLVLWLRARRRGDHDAGVVDPPSARR